MTWPHRIPHDFHIEFEPRHVDDWQTTLRAWAKNHGLKLRTQWFRGHEVSVADLRSRRYAAKPQDYWAAIREWLEKHDVPASEKLPEWPEQE